MKASINLDRVQTGNSITITKEYDGTGKVCKNDSVMFGVIEDDVKKNLFVHQDENTKKVIDYLNNMSVNTSVQIVSDHDGGYTLKDAVIKTSTPKHTDTPDWDAIAAGKVRHGFAVEAFKMGKKLDKNTMDEIGAWVDFVINGDIDLPF